MNPRLAPTCRHCIHVYMHIHVHICQYVYICVCFSLYVVAQQASLNPAGVESETDRYRPWVTPSWYKSENTLVLS